MKISFIIIPALMALVFLSVPVAYGEEANVSPSEFPSDRTLPDRYILYFEPGTDVERIQQIYRELGIKEEKFLPQINARIVVVESPGNIDTKIFNRFSEITAFEPDHAADVSAIPDDIKFDRQWGLEKIQAAHAWDITRGSEDIIIAILDTGIDSNHPDLAGKVITRKNFSRSFTVEDVNGHGTHVAGIAAAVANNGLGIAGLACQARLMNVKVLDDTGSGSYSGISQGIIWAADNGADVINLSMYGGLESMTLKQAVDYAWNKGVVVLSAAGNGGNSNPAYPAYYDTCISVTAVNPIDRLYSFSNYGAWVDIAAPGESQSTLPENTYGTRMGTSMAVPFASGLAALALTIAEDSNGDGKLNDEVRAALIKGCDEIGITGAGAGRINAWRTLMILEMASSSGRIQPGLTRPAR